jgi:predicted transcriptional regulator
MDLKPGCEGFAKKIVPVLRAKIAQSLANDYELQQHDISKKLGVTQAAVSFYLGKERGANATMAKKFPEIDVAAKKMAKAIFNGKKEEELTEIMCELCHKLRKKRGFKTIVKL